MADTSGATARLPSNGWAIRLSSARRNRVTATLLGTLVAANLAAWIWAWLAFRTQPALLGTAFLAWTFGLRHAVDPDHIAAIDNVVRKLMQDGGRPLTAGLWFSLGHSTIVIMASLVVAATSGSILRSLGAWKAVGDFAGASISAMILLAIGLANLVILRGIWRTFRHVQRGESLEDGVLARMLAGGGFMGRLYRPLFRSISRTWHMYPLGLLFGLSFDTATEIGVLGIAAVQAQHGMSPWTILVFPALFTAAMALVDTTDSVLMTGAYGFAFINPLRKLWYNLTMTVASVLIAFLIGGMEVVGLVGNRLALKGSFWDAVGGRDGTFQYLGIAVIGLFAGCWVASALIYRCKRYDTRALTSQRVRMCE
jgi:high-affinity nickel-transport protein